MENLLKMTRKLSKKKIKLNYLAVLTVLPGFLPVLALAGSDQLALAGSVRPNAASRKSRMIARSDLMPLAMSIT